MTALLAMIVGISAVGYAVWPLIRGAAVPPLTDRPHPGREEVEGESAALLAWSTAAGEMPDTAKVAAPLDRRAP